MEIKLVQIQSKIYELRGRQVMFDFDLAEAYQVETKQLNQSVKRNIKRFPPDFMFQLTSEEWKNLKSQFVTSSWGGARKLPYAFTEQGLAMLSGILNSDIAELQAYKRIANKPRNPIGFTIPQSKPKDEKDENLTQEIASTKK